jgi:hypothetical protein
LRDLVAPSKNLRRRQAKRAGKPRNRNRALLQLMQLEDRMAPAILPPTISMGFDPGQIPLNGTATLTYTITNPNASPLTGIAFTDELGPALRVTLPAPAITFSGVVNTADNPASGVSTLSLSDGTLGPNGSGTITAHVQGLQPGQLVTTTSPVTSNEGGAGNTAIANITVVAPPSLGMSFGASSIPLNGTTSLTFNIGNPNPWPPATTLHGISFSDTLPPGLMISTPNGLVGSVGGGTITAIPGTNVITLSDCTLDAGLAFNFSVNVTGTTAGVKNNTTLPITSIEGGTGSAASASVTVIGLQPPTMTMTFDPTVIALNGAAKLTFTITNPSANNAPLTGLAFTDNLPSGLVVASPPNVTNTTGGSVSGTAGTINLTGGTLAPNSTATITVTVTSGTAGTYNNAATVTSTESGPGTAATASLTVVAPQPPIISKAFDSTAVPLNGTTRLTFTIANPFANDGLSLTGVAFTDTLPAGLVVASPPHLTSTAGGTVTAAAGSNTITLSGGTLAPNSTATITVDVTGTTAGPPIVNSVQVASTEAGPGNTASASIRVVDPAHVWYVTTTADDTVNPYPESLRYDIQHAQDGDLIIVNPGPHDWDTDFPNIHLYGQITITKSLTITGNDWSNISSDKGVQGRIFNILTTDPVEISHLKLINNSHSAAPIDGGAIYSLANLTLDHVTVSGNAIEGTGGGLGGGIFNLGGTLTLTDCTVGGSAVEGGGIFSLGGTTTLTASTISGGAQQGGAIYNLGGTAALLGCTVTGSALAGGGIYNYQGPLTLINSTVAGCTAGSGPDILGNTTPGTGGGIYNSSAPLTLTNCTVAYNSATDGLGDGIYGVEASMLIFNTIVADNGPFPGMGNGSHNFTDLYVASLAPGGGLGLTGNDLIRTVGGVVSSFDHLTADPLFDAPWYFPGDLDHNDPQYLRDNGGPTKTLALQAGSPALRAGNPYLALDYSTATPTPLLFDQRGPGYSRFHTDGSVDIGAFEVQNAPYFAYLAVPVSSLELLYGHAGGLKTRISFNGRPVTAGAVTFREGSNVLARDVLLDENGQAVLPTAGLRAGLHSILVEYSGAPGVPAASYSAQMSVARAPLTITARDLSKKYGQALTFAGTEFTADGLVTANGDAVTSVLLASDGAAATAPILFSPVEIGPGPDTGPGADPPYPIVPSTADGTGLDNYIITYVNGALTINPAPLTITARDASKTYGQAVTFGGNEFTASGLVTANGDTVTGVTLSSDGAAAAAGVANSPYPIVSSAAAGSGLDNYTITYVNGALTVKPAPLTITANDQTKIQGEANPPFTARYDGLVLGEGPGVLTGTLAYSTPATAGSLPGDYAVTPSGQASSNYAITFVPGTLHVISYAQATANLQARVDSAGLDQGTQNALDSKLQAAIASFSRGDNKAAVNQLGAFINQVSALRGKKVAADLADSLVADAQRIIKAVS